MIPDWTERAGCNIGMAPPVPETYSQLAIQSDDWCGPIWIEPYATRWRLRYVLPGGGERSEMFADRRRAVARELDIEDRIRRGTFIDVAYLRADATEMLTMLVLTAPSPRAARPLHEVGRIARLNSICAHVLPHIVGDDVATFIRRALELDQMIEASAYADTTKANARHHLRWLLRVLCDLGLCDTARVRALPTIPMCSGRAEVPTDDDYEAVLARLTETERLGIAIIEATLCRPSEFDGLMVRDWRRDLHLLTVRAGDRSRSRTKTGAVAGYELTGELEGRLADAVGQRTGGPLITAEDGRHLTERVLARSIAAACYDVGVTALTLRDFRMIGASRHLAEGTMRPEQVSIRLRHAGLQTSERYYWRTVPGRERVAADAIATVLTAARTVTGRGSRTNQEAA